MGKSLIKNNIRTLRFFNGEMTQKELAEQIGVTRQTLIAIENEKYSPSLELAFRIASVFGKSVEEIFTFEQRNQTESKKEQ